MNKTPETTAELFVFLAKTNEGNYNLRKLAEELFELGEVVIKKINKDGTDKEPPMEKLIEEMGDVLFRIWVLSYQYNIHLPLGDRISAKTDQFIDYIKEDKYIGRI